MNIKKLGVQGGAKLVILDSKVLTAEQRNRFVASLDGARTASKLGWIIRPISPTEISQAMLKKYVTISIRLLAGTRLISIPYRIWQ